MATIVKLTFNLLPKSFVYVLVASRLILPVQAQESAPNPSQPTPLARLKSALGGINESAQKKFDQIAPDLAGDIAQSLLEHKSDEPKEPEGATNIEDLKKKLLEQNGLILSAGEKGGKPTVSAAVPLGPSSVDANGTPAAVSWSDVTSKIGVFTQGMLRTISKKSRPDQDWAPMFGPLNSSHSSEESVYLLKPLKELHSDTVPANELMMDNGKLYVAHDLAENRLSGQSELVSPFSMEAGSEASKFRQLPVIIKQADLAGGKETVLAALDLIETTINSALLKPNNIDEKFSAGGDASKIKIGRFKVTPMAGLANGLGKRTIKRIRPAKANVILNYPDKKMTVLQHEADGSLTETILLKAEPDTGTADSQALKQALGTMYLAPGKLVTDANTKIGPGGWLKLDDDLQGGAITDGVQVDLDSYSPAKGSDYQEVFGFSADGKTKLGVILAPNAGDTRKIVREPVPESYEVNVDTLQGIVKDTIAPKGSTAQLYVDDVNLLAFLTAKRLIAASQDDRTVFRNHFRKRAWALGGDLVKLVNLASLREPDRAEVMKNLSDAFDALDAKVGSVQQRCRTEPLMTKQRLHRIGKNLADILWKLVDDALLRRGIDGDRQASQYDDERLSFELDPNAFFNDYGLDGLSSKDLKERLNQLCCDIQERMVGCQKDHKGECVDQIFENTKYAPWDESLGMHVGDSVEIMAIDLGDPDTSSNAADHLVDMLKELEKLTYDPDVPYLVGIWSGEYKVSSNGDPDGKTAEKLHYDYSYYKRTNLFVVKGSPTSIRVLQILLSLPKGMRDIQFAHRSVDLDCTLEAENGKRVICDIPVPARWDENPAATVSLSSDENVDSGIDLNRIHEVLLDSNNNFVMYLPIHQAWAGDEDLFQAFASPGDVNHQTTGLQTILNIAIRDFAVSYTDLLARESKERSGNDALSAPPEIIPLLSTPTPPPVAAPQIMDPSHSKAMVAVGSTPAQASGATPATTSAPAASAIPLGQKLTFASGQSVFADIATNSLLIVAPPLDAEGSYKFFKFLDDLVVSLDQQRKMVEISLMVMDLEENRALQWSSQLAATMTGSVNQRPVFGVSGFNVPPGTGGKPGTFTQILNPASTSSSSSTSASSSTAGSSTSSTSPTINSNILGSSGLNVGALVVGSSYSILASFNGLDQTSNTKVYERESILTADNSTVTFADQQVFYLSSTGLYSGSLVQVNSGLTLTVTPQVVDLGKGGTAKRRPAVRLQLDMDDEPPTPPVPATTPSNVIATIDASHVQSNTVVEEGLTLMLAGRLRRIDGNMVNGVPILDRIPVLGYVFKNTNKQHARLQRLIFVTPRIVDPGSYQDYAAEAAKLALHRHLPPAKNPKGK